MSNKRFFTAKELAEAGEPTADAIARLVNEGKYAQASKLLDRFAYEIKTMYYSYRNWEQVTIDALSDQAGDKSVESVLSRIENSEIAPERCIPIKGANKAWDRNILDIKTLLAEPDREADDIGSPQVVEVIAKTYALRDSALAVHDGMMSRITALMSELYHEYGERAVSEVLKLVMQPEAMDPGGKLPFKEKIEKIIHFNRAHFQRFTLEEDDEKITFLPNPCGSGQRLIQQGHYSAPRNGVRVKGPSPLTYGREDLPVYCCHEPAMEMNSVLSTGVPIFIVDPPADVGVSPCKVYVYKKPADIPEEYYRRLGLERPGDLIAVSEK